MRYRRCIFRTAAIRQVLTDFCKLRIIFMTHWRPEKLTAQLLVLSIAQFLFHKVAYAEITKPIFFVIHLVTDLGQIHRMRNLAADEGLKNNSNFAEVATACIRGSTSLALELRSEANWYNGVALGGQFSVLGPAVATILQEEAALNDRLVTNCKSLLIATNVTQMNITRGEFAELSAQLDYLDNSTFKQIMPMAIFSLIGDKPDAAGHMSILNITKAERSNLIKLIDDEFGPKLIGKNPPYLMASLVLLKGWLQRRDLKASDEAQ